MSALDPAALTRLPSEIVEAVEAIWQRSLGLAAQSAKNDQNAARERERALADSRVHLLSTLRVLEHDRATLKAREARILELETQVEDYRRQLALLVTRAVARNRTSKTKKRRSPRPPAAIKTLTRNRPKKRSQLKRPKPRARR
jgi:hypothetical protein